MIGTRLAHYEITAHLGSGGFGDVYQATDTKLGRSVAIKLLPEAFTRDAERVARFEREARVLAALNHSNIAAIYGIDQAGGRKFIVMELVPGETLADRIRRGPIPVDEALGIARQIAEALEAAHDSEKGIIHRDLKPSNAKITPDGKVKVLDFGLAKALETPAASTDFSNSPTAMSMAATNAGVILGTAAYMSPEQAKGQVVDRRTDIFAFGAVLYEMLTGRQAFGGQTVGDILAAVIRAEPDWDAIPNETPPSIRSLLRRCLEKDRRRRLQTAVDAQIAIDEARAEPEAAARQNRRRLLGWLWPSVAGLALLAAATVSVIHLRESPAEPQNFRYTLAGPESARVQDEFALSPDGRNVVMRASGDQGAQLWVRSLDSLEWRGMAGTQDAKSPFWSPDSSFIGFFAQGKLKKIALTGGPAQILCDATNGIGGAWNSEGTILFAPANIGGLRRVSSAGGVPVEVIRSDDTGNSHRYPWFLPDGRRFLYQDVGEQSGIYIASLDSAEIRRIVPDNSRPAYLAPAEGEGFGHLLFVRDGTLMDQSVDPNSLESRGDAVLVAENLSTDRRSNYSVAANGVLAFAAGSDQDDQQYTWYDRAGKILGVPGERGQYASLSLSPDGSQAAGDPRMNGRRDIWLLDLARNASTRFTFEPANHDIYQYPIWSPDGSQIVFKSEGPGRDVLYRKPSNGLGNQEVIASSSTRKQHPKDWSRDGRFLLYTEQTANSGADVIALPLSGDRKPIPVAQTPAFEDNAQFSPDTHWVAYSSDESGQAEIYVVPFPPVPGGAKWLVSKNGGAKPRWRRDGRELFYISPDGQMMAVEIKATEGIQAGIPQALFQTQIYGATTLSPTRWDVTADGKKFLVVTQAGNTAGLTIVSNWTAGSVSFSLRTGQ